MYNDNLNMTAKRYGRSVMRMARGYHKNKALFYIDNEDGWDHISEVFTVKEMEEFLDDKGIRDGHNLEDAVSVVKSYLQDSGFDV